MLTAGTQLSSWSHSVWGKMLCISSMLYKFKFTCPKSCASKLDGNMPLRRSPIVSPATLNSCPHTFDVATTKQVSKYFELVYWVDKRCCLRNLSAKGIPMSRSNDKAEWSSFSKCLTNFYSVGERYACSLLWILIKADSNVGLTMIPLLGFKQLSVELSWFGTPPERIRASKIEIGGSWIFWEWSQNLEEDCIFNHLQILILHQEENRQLLYG